ncbi:MAG: helix-turn-helix domain-containing protein, partial [Hyphomicrobiales bacterium]|nr:helix-turn-helix domain-containing protein [Hyphomicrobiales bacterium]
MMFGSEITIEERHDGSERVCAGHARRNAEARVFGRVCLAQNQLAKAVGISPNQIAEIINNRRRITADNRAATEFVFWQKR